MIWKSFREQTSSSSLLLFTFNLCKFVTNFTLLTVELWEDKSRNPAHICSDNVQELRWNTRSDKEHSFCAVYSFRFIFLQQIGPTKDSLSPEFLKFLWCQKTVFLESDFLLVLWICSFSAISERKKTLLFLNWLKHEAVPSRRKVILNGRVMLNGDKVWILIGSPCLIHLTKPENTANACGVRRDRRANTPKHPPFQNSHTHRLRPKWHTHKMK